MEWLNYHHLYYFSVIAQEGGVASAARKLRVTHSTLSAQLRALEEHFGLPLFERRGKRLVLTPFGVETAGYAADIFRLGRELSDRARGKASPRGDVLRIGLVASIPKTLAYHLIAPAMDRLESGMVRVQQGTESHLIEALVTGRLHLVLTSEVPATMPGVKIHAHVLGETEILLYGHAELARVAKRKFPQSLSRVPMVLPPAGSPLRLRMDGWFASHQVEVTVRAEIDDSGLLRTFGSARRGVFPVRAALKAEVEDLRDVQLVGACDGIRERYFALTTDRRIKHPALTALVENARTDLRVAHSGSRNARGDS